MAKTKQLAQCKHPNSRKTKVLAKHINKQSKKEKRKLSTYMKQNVLGEKLAWFRDNINLEQDKYTPLYVEQLILKYLARFDDELEQIKLKHSIGQRKNQQHASREAIINMTIERELEEFKTCGIELPDLLNSTQLRQLKMWSGELRYLQHFKLRRFSIESLKEEKDKENKRNTKIVCIESTNK